MTELIFLGIGAIRPAIPGDHTALLLRHGGANILLDAGPAVMVQLDRAGVDPGEISHIYFSHQHGDHTLGSPIILFHHRPRVILGTPEVLKAWRHLLDVVYPGYADVLADDLEIHQLPVMQPHMWPDLPNVTAKIAMVHHANVPAYALRMDFAPIDGPDFSLVYSGDTTPTECVEILAQDVDLLIHESTYSETLGQNGDGVHTSARAAGRVAQAAGAKNLALVHRLAGNPEIWRQEATETYEGRILVPTAGDRLRLPDDLLS